MLKCFSQVCEPALLYQGKTVTSFGRNCSYCCCAWIDVILWRRVKEMYNLHCNRHNGYLHQQTFNVCNIERELFGFITMECKVNLHKENCKNIFLPIVYWLYFILTSYILSILLLGSIVSHESPLTYSVWVTKVLFWTYRENNPRKVSNFGLIK